MMRLSTLFWIALGILLIFGVFHLKREVHALEEELTRLSRTILAEEEAIQVLQAEWSYLNQPARLRDLVKRHLDLAPMKPAQLGRVGDLPHRPAAVVEPAATDLRAADPQRRVAQARPGSPAAKPAAGSRGPAGGSAVPAGHEPRGAR